MDSVRLKAVSLGSLHRNKSVSSHHEARAPLVQPDAHPTPRRVALLAFANPVRSGTAPSAA